MPVDSKSIGQGRPVQDPEDGYKQSEGTYQDPVEKVSQQELIDYTPKGPDPKPFTIKKGR